jgi:hypothetical protein
MQEVGPQYVGGQCISHAYKKVKAHHNIPIHLTFWCLPMGPHTIFFVTYNQNCSLSII